ncbi:MAG: extracellular solute-binding protein [Lachnospiraceae bacterium]|nr:extracellular solute-binding protein [Lachnospiraceae bacterium]
MRKSIKAFSALAISALLATSIPVDTLGGRAYASSGTVEKEIVLRVCNWEEYMDLGDWDEDEVIDLDSGDIFGEKALYEEFEDWYYENYGERVRVEYSCFGTNEELYNMLTLGDEYDLVCPSEYMIMKLMSEDWLVPYSETFFNTDVNNNYYSKNVSPYIKEKFETHDIDGKLWSEYAAGYMWGVTGFLYNPDEVTEEQISTMNAACDPDMFRQITLKDNVRDSYFLALGAIKSDKLTSEDFRNDPDYSAKLEEEMNDVSDETIAEVLDYLQAARKNVYSFETDSGKADMITGKVVANYQWSGDAVYAMDQAEEEDYYLNFAVPEESTNLWFDGWVMLKKGIGEDRAKQRAAEAFVNFLSMPENAIRNMYYIGYTSVISGNEEDDRVFEYLEWNYSADDDEEEASEYDVSYFFGGEPGDYTMTVPEEQTRRQLYAQYPPEDVIRRSSIMRYFDVDTNAAINHMWISVRCYNLLSMPIGLRILAILLTAGLVVLVVRAIAISAKARREKRREKRVAE